MNRNSAKTFIAKFLNLDLAQLADESKILTDIVSESFILIELIIELQEEFKVRLHQEDLAEVKSLGQLLDVLETKHNS